MVRCYLGVVAPARVGCRGAKGFLGLLCPTVRVNSQCTRLLLTTRALALRGPAHRAHVKWHQVPPVMAVHLVHCGTRLCSRLGDLLAQARHLSFKLYHTLNPLQVEPPGGQVSYTPQQFYVLVAVTPAPPQGTSGAEKAPPFVDPERLGMDPSQLGCNGDDIDGHGLVPCTGTPRHCPSGGAAACRAGVRSVRNHSVSAPSFSRNL